MIVSCSVIQEPYRLIFNVVLSTGYGMGYAGYPNAPYYGGYGGAPYYPPYAGTPPAPFHPPAPPPDGYLPPNPQW